MPLEAHAIVAPADQLMLVALLVTLARDNAIAFPAAAPGRASEESLLKRLAQLSLTEIHRLAETGALKLVVHYDSDQVAWSLQAAARKHAEQALLQYFVRHGAPRALLRELFKVSRERIEAVRQDLRLVPMHGRPKLPARARARSDRHRLEPTRERRGGFAGPLPRASSQISLATRSLHWMPSSGKCLQSSPPPPPHPENLQRPRRFPRRPITGGRPRCQREAHGRAPSCPQVTDGKDRSD